MLICGTYPIRNAITVDFGVSTAKATSAEAFTASPYPKRDHKHSDPPATRCGLSWCNTKTPSGRSPIGAV